jgi:hypothetical protein
MCSLTIRQVMLSAKLGNNYTVLLSVEVFEAGTGTLIINERAFVTLEIKESKPVLRLVFGGQPYIVRGYDRQTRFAGLEPEPSSMDASFRYVCLRPVPKPYVQTLCPNPKKGSNFPGNPGPQSLSGPEMISNTFGHSAP